jgi:hypothetical protein
VKDVASLEALEIFDLRGSRYMLVLELVVAVAPRQYSILTNLSSTRTAI